LASDPILKSSTDIVSTVSIIFDWKDQGSDRRKGKVRVLLLSDDGTIVAQKIYQYAPHQWETQEEILNLDQVLVNLAQDGYSYAVEVMAGWGGAHVLYLRDFELEVNFAKEQEEAVVDDEEEEGNSVATIGSLKESIVQKDSMIADLLLQIETIGVPIDPTSQCNAEDGTFAFTTCQCEEQMVLKNNICVQVPVDCVDGDEVGTGLTCTEACDGQCCAESSTISACSGFTGRIHRDGSCTGFEACVDATIDEVKGPSCTGWEACKNGKFSLVKESCNGKDACRGIRATSIVDGTITEMTNDKQCSRGHYIDNGECSPCNAGELGTNGVTCESCSAGTYNENLGQTVCKPCPLDTFSNKIGSTSRSNCNSCPRGKTIIYTGATMEDECTNCPVNTYGLPVDPESGTAGCMSCGDLYYVYHNKGDTTCNRTGATSVWGCAFDKPADQNPDCKKTRGTFYGSVEGGRRSSGGCQEEQYCFPNKGDKRPRTSPLDKHYITSPTTSPTPSTNLTPR